MESLTPQRAAMLPPRWRAAVDQSTEQQRQVDLRWRGLLKVAGAEQAVGETSEIIATDMPSPLSSSSPMMTFDDTIGSEYIYLKLET